MNRHEAKEILLRRNPGDPAGEDSEMKEAREFARRDPELRQWFEGQERFQTELRRQFRELPVPPDLRGRILRGPVMVPLWRQPAVAWSIAAALVVSLSLWFLWAQTSRLPELDQSAAAFSSRMVRNVLRQYRMEIFTNEDREIREYLARRGAPSDYVLPDELQALPRLGGGRLSWNGHPVAMVCFEPEPDSKPEKALFLFVLDRSAVPDYPAGKGPRTDTVKNLHTATWTEGDLFYLLAGRNPVRPLL